MFAAASPTTTLTYRNDAAVTTNRKRNGEARAGREKGGEHFWARLDSWFAEKTKLWGNRVTSAQWKAKVLFGYSCSPSSYSVFDDRCADETVSKDRKEFPAHSREAHPLDDRDLNAYVVCISLCI